MPHNDNNKSTKKKIHLFNGNANEPFANEIKTQINS